MLYLGNFNKNYFSVGNNPFFYQEGQTYPDDCNIKVPYFIVYNGYSGTYLDNFNDLVNYYGILYYAPFLNNYVIVSIRAFNLNSTLYPVLFYIDDSNITNSYEKIHPYLYNVNNKVCPAPSLCFCEELYTYNGTIKNCYFSKNKISVSISTDLSSLYTYTCFAYLPTYDYDFLTALNIKIDEYSYGGYYSNNMVFDFNSIISLKSINHYGVVSPLKRSCSWNFYGYYRSNNAIDLTPKNDLINGDVAGKYESIMCKNGTVTTNYKAPIYLGLSLYKINVDNLDYFLYFTKDVFGSILSSELINRTDTFYDYYQEYGKDIENKVSIGDLMHYEKNSNGVFVEVSRNAVINMKDTLHIGGYWKSDNYSLSENNYRISEDITVTFTYIKNDDAENTYSNIDLKYSGSTLDASLLARKPCCFMMELQRLEN